MIVSSGIGRPWIDMRLAVALMTTYPYKSMMVPNGAPIRSCVLYYTTERKDWYVSFVIDRRRYYAGRVVAYDGAPYVEPWGKLDAHRFTAMQACQIAIQLRDGRLRVGNHDVTDVRIEAA